MNQIIHLSLDKWKFSLMHTFVCFSSLLEIISFGVFFYQQVRSNIIYSQILQKWWKFCWKKHIGQTIRTYFFPKLFSLKVCKIAKGPPTIFLFYYGFNLKILRIWSQYPRSRYMFLLGRWQNELDMLVLKPHSWGCAKRQRNTIGNVIYLVL
jgi:hypothetical protein